MEGHLVNWAGKSRGERYDFKEKAHINELSDKSFLNKDKNVELLNKVPGYAHQGEDKIKELYQKLKEPNCHFAFMSGVDKLGKSNWVQTKVTAPATTKYLKMVHVAIDQENASHMAGEHIAIHQTEARGNATDSVTDSAGSAGSADSAADSENMCGCFLRLHMFWKKQNILSAERKCLNL